MSDLTRVHTERLSRQQEIKARCSHPSNTFIEFKKSEIEQSISSRFEKQAAEYPDRVATRTRCCELTYDALNQLANRVARAILSRRGIEEEPIALLLETDALVIATILGVLKTGKFFVTLDPLFPPARLEYMLADSQAGLVVTSTKHVALARKLARNEQQVLNIDEIHANLSAGNLDLTVSPDAFAYIVYTSGSTGQPKGIVYNHRNVLVGIRNYTNAFRICRNDRLTLLHSCSFSSAMVDIWCALLNGAAACPWDVKREGLADMEDWLARERITVFNWVPTPFHYLVETLTGETKFPSLRLLVLASEPVSKRDVDLYKEHFSANCIFVNRLGTTETYNYRLYFVDHESQIDGSLVPAGYAVPDKHVLLLDDAGQEIGFNSVGEIAIKSAYLAVGYWREPELTGAAFQSDPAGGSNRIYRTGDLGIMRPDGCLEYLGRKDFQVKIRGHRVEVAEIEMTLVALDAVKEAVVVAREDEAGERHLVAYFVPTAESAPTDGQLRTILFQTLPDYMIPSAFVRLVALPLTPTGKVDRRALPVSDTVLLGSERTCVAPRDELECRLTKTWELVLGVQPIGVKDNFFELGGHSLLAVRLLAQIEQTFGRKLPPPILFQFPTVEQLAGFLRENLEEGAVAWSPLVAIRSIGSKPPFFCLPGNMGNVFTDLGALARHLGPDQPFYGLQDSIQNPARIEDLATCYLAAIQGVQSEGPYFLGGVCSGGVVAFEMAQQLKAQRRQVALLALVEPARPWGPSLRCYLSFAELILRRIVRRLGHHSRNVSQLDSAGRGDYLRLKLKLVANVWALRRYVPQPYAGQIHLFLSNEALRALPSPQLRWCELATEGGEVHEIPGNHDVITGDNDVEIEEASMQALAEQLKRCIDEALAGLIRS